MFHLRSFNDLLYLKSFTKDQAQDVWDKLGLDSRDFDFDEFSRGLNVELEHRDITKGNITETAKIVIAHLKEKRDYYTALAKMEKS